MAQLCEYGHLYEILIKSETKDVGIYKFRYETWKTACNKCWYQIYNVVSIRDFTGHKKHHELCNGPCLIHKEKNCICWCHSKIES